MKDELHVSLWSLHVGYFGGGESKPVWGISNSVENINRAIRQATKTKRSCESPDRLLDYTSWR